MRRLTVNLTSRADDALKRTVKRGASANITDAVCRALVLDDALAAEADDAGTVTIVRTDGTLIRWVIL